MSNVSFGLTGRVKASVIRDGVVVRETDWTRNLWLDGGLDRLAELPLCDLFAYAVKGTGFEATSDDLSATPNTYSIANGSSTLERTAGTRDFSSDDIGRLFKFTTAPFAEFTVTAYTDANTVEVKPNATAAVSDKKVVVYLVNQTKLDPEIGRTNTYSSTPGENSTTTAGNVRTFKRTFLFPTEDVINEVVSDSNTYNQTLADPDALITASIVTRVTGTRDFTNADIGTTITFKDSGLTALIDYVDSPTSVRVRPSQENPTQNISLSRNNTAKIRSVSGTSSRSGFTLTRESGAWNFVPSDVGSIVYFTTDQVEARVTAFVDGTHLTLDTGGTLAAQPIKLYGYTNYREVGFSHTAEKGRNLNIRVKFDAPVNVNVSTPLRASEQLKLTYECKLTVTPNVATTQSLASIISDPGNLMSGNKNGKMAIESFATSVIGPDGETVISFPDLEPFYPGFAALSSDATALAPLSGKVRETSTAFVEMEAELYTSGSFSRTYLGSFGLNDAVGTAWRSLMIYDPDSKSAVFTFLYDSNQRKDGEHTFQVWFKKSWNRDLS